MRLPVVGIAGAIPFRGGRNLPIVFEIPFPYRAQNSASARADPSCILRLRLLPWERNGRSSGNLCRSASNAVGFYKSNFLSIKRSCFLAANATASLPGPAFYGSDELRSISFFRQFKRPRRGIIFGDHVGNFPGRHVVMLQKAEEFFGDTGKMRFMSFFIMVGNE